MRTNQRKLGEMFFAGATEGSASNVEIEHYPALGVTAVIGYGHAVYATRDENGYVTTYEGWRSRSVSTRCQMTKMKLTAHGDRHLDKRKSRGTLRRAEKKARRETAVA